MERRILYTLGLTTAWSFVAMAALLLSSGIFGAPLSKVDAESDCDEKVDCDAVFNATCTDDACDSFLILSSQIAGNDVFEYRRPVPSSGEGYSTWNLGTQVLCYVTRACVRSETIPCPEDDTYNKLVDGTGAYVDKFSNYPLTGIAPCTG